MRRTCVLAAFVLAYVVLISPGGVRAQTPGVTVDAKTDGNTARNVASVDECVEAQPGQAVTIDVVLLGSGVPGGFGGFEFRLLFDPRVIWVTTEDTRQLLAQASGSSPFAVGDQLPNQSGEYLSVAVDFGPKGAEPAGSAELGGGIISRLTISAQATGESVLRLSGVTLVDGQAETLPAQISGEARIVVGSACQPDSAAAPPSAAPAATGAPTAATTAAGTQSARSTGGAAENATAAGQGSGPPVAQTPGAVPVGGGPPGGTEAGGPGFLTLLGLAMAAGGAIILGAVQFTTKENHSSHAAKGPPAGQ